MFALGMLYFLMSLVIIYFIKIQQYYARIGNQDAVQAVIFPIFVYVLWANALVNIYIGTVAITFTFEPFSTHDRGATWAFSTMYSLQHMGKILACDSYSCLCIRSKITSFFLFFSNCSNGRCGDTADAKGPWHSRIPCGFKMGIVVGCGYLGISISNQHKPQRSVLYFINGVAR